MLLGIILLPWEGPFEVDVQIFLARVPINVESNLHANCCDLFACVILLCFLLPKKQILQKCALKFAVSENGGASTCFVIYAV